MQENLENLMNKRTRMNHTTVDGFHYNHDKQTATDLRRSLQINKHAQDYFERRANNK